MSDKNRFVPDILVGPSVLDKKDVESINRLRKQLSGSAQDISQTTLTDILCQPNFRLIIFKDPESDEVIGMASIYYAKTTINFDGVGRVEDVVIDERYRGHGLGDLMVRYLISTAKILRLSKLELTSNPNNPNRLTAIQLYLKQGFKKRETNCYRLDL